MADLPNRLETEPRIQDNANFFATLKDTLRLVSRTFNAVIDYLQDKFKRISVNNAATNTELTIEGPTPNGSSTLVLDSHGNATSGISGRRDGLERWYVYMPFSDNDFYIGRQNPPGTHADNPIKIHYDTGIVRIARELIAGSPNASAAIGLDKSATGNESQIRFRTNGVMQWYLAHNSINEIALCQCDPNTGGYIARPIFVSQSGATTLRATNGARDVLRLEDSQGPGSQGACIALQNSQWAWRYIRVNTSGWLCFINNAFNQETHAFGDNGDVNIGGNFQQSGWQHQYMGSNGDGSTYRYVEPIRANPDWNWIYVRPWHQFGQWAGIQFYGDGSNNTVQMVLSNGGGWGSLRAASFEVQSDRNSKEGEEVIASALDVLDGIQAYSYTFKSAKRKQVIGATEEEATGEIYGEKRRHVGTYAQDWLLRLPQAVKEFHDGDGPTLGLDYAAINAVTAQAVSELLQRVKTLEARVSALEGA